MENDFTELTSTGLSISKLFDAEIGWSIGNVLVTGILWSGWSIGNVVENVFGLTVMDATNAGSGEAMEAEVEGEAKSPKSSSSMIELGWDADWGREAAGNATRPELSLTEAGSCGD